MIMVHTKNISIIKGQQNINTTTSTGVDDNDNADNADNVDDNDNADNADNVDDNDNADNADNNTVKKASLFF
jgi:hypothetical protein